MLSDIQVETVPSPLTQNDIDGVSCIATLGSPGYNLVSQWAETQLKPNIVFGLNNTSIVRTGVPPITDPKQAFIQRLYDSQSQRYVFYVGGISETGTVGAAYFLAARWKELYERHKKDQVFAHVISINPNNYRDAAIVF